jgi:hypothetical protein
MREAKGFRENPTCIVHDRIAGSSASTSSALCHDNVVKSGWRAQTLKTQH